MYQAAYAAVRRSLWYATTEHGKIRGQAFLVHDRVAVTAQHVVDAGGVAVGKWDGLWATEQVITDPKQDVSVLLLKDRITSRKFEPDQAESVFPQISATPLTWGDDVAVMGTLRREHATKGTPASHKMITRGIVAYRTMDPWQWAVHGAFAEPGFSGGPAFRPDGQFVGVVTAVSSTKSLTDAAVPMDFPLVSPLVLYRQQILDLIAKLPSQSTP